MFTAAEASRRLFRPTDPGHTLVKNVLLPPLPRSLPAAGTGTGSASEEGARSGRLLGAASDVSASCSEEWEMPSLPWPSDISKGSGHLSSGLEPSSLVLALQSIRDRERARNLVGFRLFPERPCGSILKEAAKLPFFLS